jgi:hypothetical protein
MRASSLMTVGTVIGILTSAPVGAQEDLEGRWTIAVQGGTDSEISGDVIKSTTGTLLDRTVEVESQSYRNVYRPNLRGQLMIGYGVNPNQEIVARGSYYKSDAAEGQFFLVGTFEGSELFALLDPYEEYGVELAYRFYLASRTRLKSYIAPVGGVRFLDRVLISFSAPERGSGIANLPFYKSSSVGVFGADIGFTYDLGQTFYVGLEAGIRYQTKRSPSTLPPGISGMNEGGERWSAPVVVSLGFRF